MDYFTEKSNPFYDRTCNNEIVKMQRQSLEHLNNMVGVEYILLHVQDPILYVVRKQHRHSPTEATPLADYYIIAGTVYQAPDLASVFNSRLLSTVHNLQSAFEEVSSYAKYHASKGYSWDFSANKSISEKAKIQPKKETTTKEEPSSIFQRKRVDMLLAELVRKFPPPFPQPPNGNANPANANAEKPEGGETAKTDAKSDTPVKIDTSNIKTEPGTTTTTETPNTTNSTMKTEVMSPSASEIHTATNIDIKQEHSNSDIMKPPEKKMKLN
jgi:mediator of RNA polymerase II transcription subunit 6